MQSPITLTIFSATARHWFIKWFLIYAISCWRISFKTLVTDWSVREKTTRVGFHRWKGSTFCKFFTHRHRKHSRSHAIEHWRVCFWCRAHTKSAQFPWQSVMILMILRTQKSKPFTLIDNVIQRRVWFFEFPIYAVTKFPHWDYRCRSSSFAFMRINVCASRKKSIPNGVWVNRWTSDDSTNAIMKKCWS